MMKLKKRLATAGLVLTLSLTSMLPAMAAGKVCSGCGGTNTEPLSNLQTTEYVKEACIHGGGMNERDNVGYLVVYERYFCNTCNVVKTKQISRTEMSRACHRM